ncbi:unnamed protein product [Brassica oleracea var. botrytis]
MLEGIPKLSGFPKHSKTKKGKITSGNGMSCLFCNNVMLVMKVLSPMVKVLRLVDGEMIFSLSFIMVSS